MEKKYEGLVPFINKFNDENAAVKIRRNLWNSEIKSLIGNSFNNFIRCFDLPCHVAFDTYLLNQEAIYLAFNDAETGIILKSNNQMMIQSGGGLVYHQLANGKVSVTFLLPYIEGIKGEKGAKKEIGIFKPEFIDENHVLTQIELFFKEILEWECFLRQPIGFNH